MAKTTIAWTDYTWPVITGCQHASPGCASCYEWTEWARVRQLPPELERILRAP